MRRSSRRGVMRGGCAEWGRQGCFCPGLQKAHFQSVLGRPVVAVEGWRVGGFKACSVKKGAMFRFCLYVSIGLFSLSFFFLISLCVFILFIQRNDLSIGFDVSASALDKGCGLFFFFF